jgi:hypothetical protein
LKKIVLFEFLLDNNAALRPIIDQTKSKFVDEFEMNFMSHLNLGKNAAANLNLSYQEFYSLIEKSLLAINNYKILCQKLKEDKIKTVCINSYEEEINLFNEAFKQRIEKFLNRFQIASSNLNVVEVNIEKIKFEVKIINECIQELEFIEQKVPNCFKFFPFNIINKWYESINDTMVELEEQILNSIDAEDSQKLGKRVLCAKLLSKIDWFIENHRIKNETNTFLSLYNIYYSKLKELRTNLYDECKQLILDFDYENLADNLNRFNLEDEVDLNSFRKLKTNLNHSLEVSLKTAKEMAENLGF